MNEDSLVTTGGWCFVAGMSSPSTIMLALPPRLWGLSS
jgi:hypothetical protein